jgi:two-component system sensor histidine kinase SenX3
MTHKSEEIVEGLILSLQDLTDQRIAERSRSELIANLSHDLRTPITAGRLLAETIEAGVSDEKLRKKFHRSLLGELNRLSRMVERLVKLSRIESHEDEFTVLKFPVEELVVTVIDNMSTISSAAEISLLQSKDTEMFLADDPEMAGDFDRLVEVFANLIDNAISVSPRNSTIVINVFSVGEIDSQREVVFEVIDQGPGVPPADRTRIFERFYTGEASRNSQNEGLGLGLSIARHIVQRHGGEISVRNGLSGGAIFTFRLPRGVSSAKMA